MERNIFSKVFHIDIKILGRSITYKNIQHNDELWNGPRIYDDVKDRHANHHTSMVRVEGKIETHTIFLF